MDADSEMLLMCFRAGRNFFAARDFLGAFGAFGNALSLDPSSFLLLWSFHVALAYYNRSLPPNRAIILYDGVLEPIRAAAVAPYIAGFTSYFEMNYASSVRSFTEAKLRDPTSFEIPFYLRIAAQRHIDAFMVAHMSS